MIRHIAAIAYIILTTISVLGNGCVIYIFLKVQSAMFQYIVVCTRFF
jgi:hypothetical protein